MSLFVRLWFIISSIKSEQLTPINDVCSSTFSGTGGELCLEYGFCSSCVSNGCYWCEPTNRCLDSNYECGSLNDKLFSLDECNKLYEDAPIENPAMFTTEYSPHIAEILALYAEYAYGSDKISKWDLFNLDLKQINIFKAMITNIDRKTLFHLFYNIAQGYNIIGDIIPGYDGPYYDGLQYNKDELIHFIDSLHENSIYDLPFADKLIQLFDEHLILELPESNILGEMRAFTGVDHSIGGIVVSFRGTTRDFNDAAGKGNGLFSNLVRWDELNLSNISSLLVEHGIESSVTIAGYFGSGYKALKDSFSQQNGKGFLQSISEYIEQYPDYDIYITGHSLGGALANIFVLDFYAEYKFSNNFFIYTFGQPRVGNDAFASLINVIFSYSYYRVVHSNDIVPTVALWIWNYRHCGIEIHYGEGDYKNGAICQYRECTNLDPFEDPSCRSRYDDILFGQDVIELANQILSGYEYLQTIIDGNVTADGADVDGPLANIIQFYIHPDEGYGANDHSSYQHFEKGHCSVNVKCIQTNIKQMNTNNYKCLSLLSPLTNLIQNIEYDIQYDDQFESTIFDKLNGCYGAGTNQMCCLGKSHGPLTVCKEKEDDWKNQNWRRFGCPANDVSEYCIVNADCKDTLKCIDGICTAVVHTNHNKVNIEKAIIVYISENEEVRYWLHKLFDVKIDSISNLYQLFNAILSKLSHDDDHNVQNKINKINKYVNGMKGIEYWIQKIVDIDTDSITNICQLLEKILKQISHNQFNQNIDDICYDLEQQLQNIINIIKNMFTTQKKNESILLLHDKYKNLMIITLISINIIFSISFIFYCYRQQRNAQLKFKYNTVNVHSSYSTDEDNHNDNQL